MASNATFAQVAAAAGDLARAAMLHALMDGRALTASELAHVAGVAPQTASSHLAHLTSLGLLTVEKQGRHRYHRLNSPAVARMLESIMQVAARLEPANRRLTIGPRNDALRAARTCYDHLAGRLGVEIADVMVGQGYLEMGPDAGLLTNSGMAFLARLGIDISTVAARSGKSSGRALCRPCLDWSERRPHLAGAVGAALCAHCFERGWLRRIKDSRAVAVTPKGQQVFCQQFGISRR